MDEGALAVLMAQLQSRLADVERLARRIEDH